MELVKNIDGDVLNVRSGVLIIAHPVSLKESKTIVCKCTSTCVRFLRARLRKPAKFSVKNVPFPFACHFSTGDGL